ncbi:MAG: histidine kinase N-terminal 7TM domain-containing protein, partial [Halobacteriaceae archaeon]
MVSIAHGVAGGLLLGAALGYAGITYRVKRQEEFPGRPSFLATGFTTALFLAAFTALLILSRLNIRPMFGVPLILLTFAAAMTVPLLWVRFALRYTGQGFPTGRRTFIRLGLPIVFTLLIVAGTLGVGLLTFEVGLIELPERTFALIETVTKYSVAVTGFYLTALLVVGTSLIAWTSYSFTHLSNKGGVLIGVGFILPWLGIVMPVVANLLVDHPLIRNYHAAAGAILGLGSVWLA